MTILFLCLFSLALILSCGDDDDDDDPSEGDDDSTDDDDDLSGCDPYAEGGRWLSWDNLAGMYGEFLDEQDSDSLVTAAVSLDGDDFAVEKDTYKVKGAWLSDEYPIPFADGQTVIVYQGQSAGDDGCCDADFILVWDESWNLLLAYSWNEGFNNLQFGDNDPVEIKTGTEEICDYQEGERPREGEVDWSRVSGLKLTGHYFDAQFTVDAPGNSATSSDGQFAVNWPEGYSGEILDGDGEAWWTHSSFIEIVALVD
jgi:hypothetical protein